jgi:hypothetical protein
VIELVHAYNDKVAFAYHAFFDRDDGLKVWEISMNRLNRLLHPDEQMSSYCQKDDASLLEETTK